MTTDAGDSEPVDLRSLRATDALLDRLAARRPGPAGERDPAAVLLRALLDDIEDGAGCCPPEVQEPQARRGGGSFGVRTAVAAGVASAVLAAIVGGGLDQQQQQAEPPAPGHSAGSEPGGSMALPGP